MSWRPWLEDRALRQMQGLPPEAFDLLVRTLARICDDPYDPVFSVPVAPVPGRRVADLGDFGFIEFIADEAERLVRVYHLVWTHIAAIGDPVDGEILIAKRCITADDRSHDTADESRSVSRNGGA